MDTQIPESFEETNDTDLDSIEESLTSEFDSKYEGDTPASVAELTEIAEALDKVRSEKSARIEQAAADAAAREELAGRVRTADEVEEAVADEVEEAVAEEAPVEEVVAEEAELVTAAAAPTKAPSAQALRTRSVSPPPAEKANAVTITAAADIPGVSSGQELDRLGVAKAMMSRARGLANKSPRVGIASVQSDIADEHIIRDGGPAAHEVITAAVNSKLAGSNAAALVATGGWCAPSETMYELFSVESRDGLLDLPTVGIARGGIQVPSYVGLDEVAAGLWAWSEANDINPGTDGDATKPCLQVPCPTWTDYRLGAEGICITAGNMIDRAYPEMVARTIDLAMTGHMHRISNASLATIIAAATSVTVTSVPSDAAGDILHAIDLQVADYRSQYLMGENTVLDAIFPQWFVEAIRSTLAMRAGVDSTNVSKAEVIAHFTNRNVRPQFLAGYEPLFSATPATAFPATSKFLLYPAGGYVMGDGGEIDLGVVRDSTLNATNDFTAAWSEQFFTVIERGPAAREITVTTAVDGQTGGPEFVGV